MVDWIGWCKCGRYILTTGQQRENKPCEACQKEHAASFKERMENAQKEEEE